MCTVVDGVAHYVTEGYHCVRYLQWSVIREGNHLEIRG